MKITEQVHEILYDPSRERLFLVTAKSDPVVSGYMVHQDGDHIIFHVDKEEYKRMYEWNLLNDRLAFLVSEINIETRRINSTYKLANYINPIITIL